MTRSNIKRVGKKINGTIMSISDLITQPNGDLNIYVSIKENGMGDFESNFVKAIGKNEIAEMIKNDIKIGDEINITGKVIKAYGNGKITIYNAIETIAVV